MNECDVCGHLNRDDLDFCDSCDAHLFDGEEDLRAEREELKKVKQ